MTDTILFKQIVKEKGIMLRTLCKAAGMTYATLREKVNNKYPFTVPEVMALSDAMNLNWDQTKAVFLRKAS